MKKTISAFTVTCLAAMLAACSAPKEEGFTIDFNLPEGPDCNLYVSEKVPASKAWFIDTLKVKGGKAHYEGKVEFPRLMSFHFIKEENIYGSVEMFIDNSQGIQINGKKTADAVITGCKSQDEYRSAKETMSPAFKQISQSAKTLSEAYREKAEKEVIDSLKKVKAEATSAMLDKLMNLPGYATSAVSPFFIYSYCMGNTEMLEKALSKLDPSMDQNGYVQEEKAELARQKASAIGQPAFNFCLKDIEGKEYKLSDFKGKYVLMEFSASWCGWCKKEIPFLKKVYEENKDQNFVMFTINLDETQKKWEDDVKEMNLPWPVISDLKAFQGDVPQAFNVKGIPMIYLINPEGKIEKKGLRGEEMVRTIHDLLRK